LESGNRSRVVGHIRRKPKAIVRHEVIHLCFGQLGDGGVGGMRSSDEALPRCGGGHTRVGQLGICVRGIL
jgi:hypothetical protein